VKKFLALLAMLGALVLTGCGASGGTVTSVDPAAFLTTSAQSGVVTVDVRTPSEYAAGHVAGAVNVDVEATTFDSQTSALDKSVTYAVYCHSGRRSALATDAMAKAGFTHVYNLTGGFPDLVNAGAKVATS